MRVGGRGEKASLCLRPVSHAPVHGRPFVWRTFAFRNKTQAERRLGHRRNTELKLTCRKKSKPKNPSKPRDNLMPFFNIILDSITEQPWSRYFLSLLVSRGYLPKRVRPSSSCPRTEHVHVIFLQAKDWKMATEVLHCLTEESFVDLFWNRPVLSDSDHAFGLSFKYLWEKYYSLAWYILTKIITKIHSDAIHAWQSDLFSNISVIFLPFVIQSLGQQVLASPLAVAPNNKWRYFCVDALIFSRKDKVTDIWLAW